MSTKADLLEALKDASTTFFYIKNLSTNLWRDPANIEALCERIRIYAKDAQAKADEAIHEARGA